jgi:DNA repair photolyase
MIKGRGSASNIKNRYATLSREVIQDGWSLSEGDELPKFKTEVTQLKVKSILSRNDSPDISFRYSINPYKGCEHGCIYCFARPSHAFLDLSPGLDFETKLFAKINAVDCLIEEISQRGYRCSPISIGANTDPYQPIERQYELTRKIVRVLAECRHPFNIVTKNALIERDIDILKPLAARGLVKVYVSVTTLDNRLSAKMEPRASSPKRRMALVRRLADQGIPVGVMFAPVIPFLNDAELESICTEASEAGADSLGYLLIRLPHEVKPLFFEWLDVHYPLKAEHVKSRIRAMRQGRENDTQFGRRHSGSGEYASLLKKRAEIAARRCGLSDKKELDCSQFDSGLLSGQSRLFT